ncbi:MAG: carbon-nitrogen hydrolase family protein [Halioglobus sp.]
MTRVAALQFASGTDVDANLATCTEMIDEAAQYQPGVMVLPEFCNHISWYDDADHVWDVSLEPDGAFLKAIAERADRYNTHIVINVSLRRKNRSLTITSLMFGPDGSLLAQADKQTLMGHENFWFTRATEISPVVNTEIGRLAMFPCRDGVTFETPRGLALRGAQLFCDSLNSFALDEASLHVPARAPENACFLVAANKVGPLIPEELLQQVSEDTHIPLEHLYGAGESQIVSPHGEVLARAPKGERAVVWADVDLSQSEDKRFSDGTDRFETRRPNFYTPISSAPKVVSAHNSQCVSVACLNPEQKLDAAIVEASELVGQLGSDIRLAVLPELFCMPWHSSDEATHHANEVINRLASACKGREQFSLVTALPMPVGKGVGLSAVLINESGLLASQGQVHGSARFDGLELAQSFECIDLPWGRIALLTADDMRHPEMAKLAAIEGAQLLAVPGKALEPWESSLALPSRAAENRVCLIYCSAAEENGSGLIASLHRDFTLMTPWAQRKFDGFINQPLITSQLPGQRVTIAKVDLPAANNKLMSAQTDLILDRPWMLSDDIVREIGND